MRVQFLRGPEPDSVTTVAAVNEGQPLAAGDIYDVTDELAAALLATGDWMAVEAAAAEEDDDAE
jgi:hypothetical protein